MSVPLDKLYNFLDDVVNRDTLIYRFYPSGAKLLEDCKPLYSYHLLDINQVFSRPRIYFNDQEPLNYTFYSDNKEYLRQRFDKQYQFYNKDILDLASNENLACIDGPIFFSCYQKNIIVHSEKNSVDIDLYQKNNFVTVHYWAHAVIALDWYRYAEVDPALSFNSKFLKDFLIYSRAWSGTRLYRLTLLDKLLPFELHTNSLVKFNAKDNNQHYSEVIKTSYRLEDYFEQNNSSSSSSADYSAKDYQTCAIELVLETIVSKIHLTEKILRPIACGKPFILVGCAGALSYLKSYGFETFAPFINEDYDDIPNSEDRISFIVKEMSRIARLPTDEKNELFYKLHIIAGRNRKKFFNSNFFDNVINEYKTNINDALNLLDQSKDARLFKKAYLNFKQHFPNYYSELQSIIDPKLIKPYLP